MAKNKGKKNEDKRPPLPTRADLYDKFSDKQPWGDDGEAWVQGLEDKYRSSVAEMWRGGLSPFEERRLTRLRRRMRAGEDAYKDWLKNNPGGGDGGPGQGGGPGGEQPPAHMFDQSAFDVMRMLLEQAGLGSLTDTLRRLIQDGITDAASLQLALQQTDEWKRRFAGNEMLKQNGLPVLSVAEYLAVERSYAQIFKNYGLPVGFYDDPSDFAKWIGHSVSANELQQRVQIFSDLSHREDKAITDQLKSMGLTDGDILAYTMDPTRAMPLIQRKYQTALIGGAARRAGVVGDNEYLGKLAGMGITEQQAQQGYGMIGEGLGTMKTLGQVYGDQFTQRDFESEVFENNADSAKKRKRLASQERANFSGSSGIGQGSLTRDDSGSY